MGKHADDDLQRHQPSIENNAHKRAFARDAVFLGGLGCGGGRHFRIGMKSSILIFYPADFRPSCGDTKKNPFKSSGYLNEKHSCFNYTKRLRRNTGAGKTKNRALERYAVSVATAVRHGRSRVMQFV
jgi:hypothetical protein